MPDILLIHGAAHGAWCWHRVLPALRALGHTARAIDLPGNGDDPTPAADVTLDRYAEAVLAATNGPTILVGHSMGGFPITAAAQRAPDRFTALIYLCAYLPRAGHSLAEMRKAGPRQPLAGAFQIDATRTTFTFDPDQSPALFYHDCPPEDVALAKARLCPQPIRPQETPIPDTSRAETLPRYYIRCTDDRAIPPEYQETMSSPLPPDHIRALPTSHSPFFSAPDALAALIDEIARLPSVNRA
ncbi:alpha/beta fold hydrolase [Rhodobacter sp. HX-7-19]|uniref:Alpha/beta fold hydrolase n=1 Tax=Paragemmobacter kunshanensis TaxID=2583234 RepID=A0A6M1TVZ2_9RHOB|nr:alpha/beta fold hydrolase [Rhodobacter kunshanensis]NGQ91887.1 alpha/beta fold hydrolase [Rhodobacter kunshanensis]